MVQRRTYEAAAVRAELERILASAPFRNSRRASAMLRHTVERALAGETEALKERTIGVEVFGRPTGYDTGADHVVRSTAGDVRRRLAQYYQESGDTGGARIEFASGSYVPQFGGAAPATSSESALARFWAPLAESGRTVLVSIGGTGLAPVLGETTRSRPKDQLRLSEVFALESEKVAFSDAVMLASVAAFLSSHGAAYRVVHESDVGLDDLRLGPAVLIGALNNDWGLRLADQLRFRFSFDAETLTCSILDRGEVTWKIRLDIPFAAVREDRGVVTRVRNQTTGQYVVLAAGVTMLGTLAASELLTSAEYLPEGEWERPNAQVLFSTRILRGCPAPPHVLETCFW